MKKKTHTQVLVEAHVKSWGFWVAIIAIVSTGYFVKTRIDIKSQLDITVTKLHDKLIAYEYNSKQVNQLVEYQGKIENYLFIIEEKLFFPSHNTFNLQKIYTLSDELEQQINGLKFTPKQGFTDKITELNFSINGPSEDLFYLIQEFRSRMWYNQITKIEVLNRGESAQTINIHFDLLNSVK